MAKDTKKDAIAPTSQAQQAPAAPPMMRLVAPRRVTIQDWIADALTDEDKEGPCTALVCLHKVGTSEEEIHAVTLKAEKPRTAHELAKLFDGKASMHAQNLSGVQTYVLRAFYAGKSEPQASHPFTRGGATEFAAGVTEAPNAIGQVQQVMRLTECLMQGGFAQTSAVAYGSLQVLEATMRMLQDEREHNRLLQQENRDCFTIIKEVIKEQVTNQQAHEMRKLEYERSSAERAKMWALVPPLANQVLGKEVVPQSTADTLLFEAIADSLLAVPEEKRGETLTALSGAIGNNPVLLGTLMSRLSQHAEKRAKEKAAAEELARMQAARLPTAEGLAAEGVVETSDKASEALAKMGGTA